MKKLKVIISLADQNFARTTSVGTYNVAVHLAKGLAAHPGVELTVLNTPASGVEIAGVRNIQFAGVTDSMGRRVWWDQVRLNREVHRLRPDWLFMPKGYLSFMRRPPCPTVAYVHDVMYHEYWRQGIPGFPKFKSWYFRKCVEATLRYAQVIVTNSEYTKGQINAEARACGYPEPKLVAIGIGFAAPIPAEEKQDQILALVSRWPNKITPRAVEYLSRWERQSRFAGQILCVGSLPEGTVLPARWRWLQRLPAAEFNRTMGASKALVYFTRNEGFGMPPVEAALHGTAPVFSAIPPTEEAMLGLGLPFQNEDYESFRVAMDKALACPSETVAQWARALHARHNWDRVTRELVALLTA